MAFSFKGVHASSYMKVLEVGWDVLPSSNLKMVEMEGVSGARFLNKTEGVKEIEISFVMKENNPAALKKKVREVAGWLDSFQPEQLVFDVEPDKYYLAMLSGSSQLEQIIDIGIGTITFVCFDPYAHGKTITTSLVSGGTTKIDLTATAPSYPILTITSLSDNTFFKISRGDKITPDYDPRIEITGTFKAGDVIEIDCEKGRVSVNGVVQMHVLSLISDFFPLVTGGNWLNTSQGYEISITYTERWK